MGLVIEDDGWRIPDRVWVRMEPLLPEPPSHPLGCHRPRVSDRDEAGKSHRDVHPDRGDRVDDHEFDDEYAVAPAPEPDIKQ